MTEVRVENKKREGCYEKEVITRIAPMSYAIVQCLAYLLDALDSGRHVLCRSPLDAGLTSELVDLCKNYPGRT